MQTFNNCGILICTIFLMISGIILSNHVFTFLNIQAGLGFARVAHLLASHWYYLFMSLHIGLHMGRLFQNVASKILPRILLALVCAYDLYAFIIRGVWKYLFLRQQFFSLTWSGATPSLLWTTFLLSYYLLQSYI